MPSVKDNPQILQHLQKSLTLTIHETRWIPGTARFVALGSFPRDTGCMQVYELDGLELQLVTEVEQPTSFKCGTLGAVNNGERQLATGNMKGELQLWDLANLAKPAFTTPAHEGVIYCIDGIGGKKSQGPPELATAGRDGCVRVWDVRQHDAPVAAFLPSKSEQARECWCVAFGNSYNDDERCLLAGYDNGDVKMFDLRTNSVRWQANVKNGVCGVQFDRPDIDMNKFVVTCLESHFQVYDARTQHTSEGFAKVSQTVTKGSTLWGARHMPQNREVHMIYAGDGSLSLFKYHYPDQRRLQDAKGEVRGVPGTVEELAQTVLTTQPISSFDWSPDKAGLFCCAALDQCVRVGFVTKTNLL